MLNKIQIDMKESKNASVIYETTVSKESFNDIFMGHKTYLIIENDRTYKKGDNIMLHEYDDKTSSQTGRKMARNITHVSTQTQNGMYLKEGFTILSIQ